MFRFNPSLGRGAHGGFRWRLESDDATLLRDLTWDFAEPDQYAELVSQKKPGMMASRGEKAFHAAVVAGDPEAMLVAAAQDPKYSLPANAVSGLLLLESDLDRGIALLEQVATANDDIGKDHFVRKYMSGAGLSVAIASGLIVRLPLQRNSITLLLAELHQARGSHDHAIALLEAAEKTTHVRLSLSELLFETERYDDVVATTAQVVNDDDFTALMLAYRGRALGELGRDKEAMTVFVRALEYPNRADAVKAVALVGRGVINQARGEYILAKNDFTQALIEMPEDSEARQHIQELIRRDKPDA
jgi:tetratricopeptide (TPR) repeat protein